MAGKILGNPDKGPSEGSTFAEKYEVLQQLAVGANGISYKIRERGTSVVLVLKILSAELQANTQRISKMQYAAKIAAGLSHANMVSTQYFGQDPQYGYYMLRDFVPGRTLPELLREKGVFNQIEFFDIFHQASKGISYLHRKGYVHGHIKPNNIIITEDYVVRVVDTGITRLVAQQPDGSEAIGNAAYLSPEQCLGESFDQRADIYSLACVMYESLSQNPPFGPDSKQTAMKQVQDKPTPFLSLIPARKVDPQIETIIFRCMEKKADQRYQALDALQTDMRRIEEGEEIKPLAPASAGGPPKVLVISAVFLITLIAAGGYVGYMNFANTTKPASNKIAGTNQPETPGSVQDNESESKGEEAQADKLAHSGKFGEAVEIYNNLEAETRSKFGMESKEHAKILHKLGKAQLWNSEVAGAKDSYGLLIEILRKDPKLAPKTYQPSYEIFSIAKDLYAKDKLQPADDAFTLAFRTDKSYAKVKTPMRYHMQIWQGKLEALNHNFGGSETSLEKAVYSFRSEFDDPDNLAFGLTELGRSLMARADSDEGKGGKDIRWYKKAKNYLKEALQIREMRGSPAEVKETKELLEKAKAKLQEFKDENS